MSRENRPGSDGKDDTPANDNGALGNQPLDPRILRIAEAIGRQIAREHFKDRPAVNDNPLPRK